MKGGGLLATSLAVVAATRPWCGALPLPLVDSGFSVARATPGHLSVACGDHMDRTLRKRSGGEHHINLSGSCTDGLGNRRRAFILSPL
jgi:hypothetical protein